MIFADTSFWIGLRLRRDRHHTGAEALWRTHADQQVVTSNHVLGETWTFLQRRAGHADAVDFLDRLDRSARLRTIFVERDLETEAIRWLRRHDEREYSFVDGTSFALMRSLRIREALAFDGDFSAAGFHELRPG